MLAYRAHEGQKRKYSGIPYIAHPAELFFRFCGWVDSKERPEFDGDWILILKCAAWLHDVKEDCPQITDDQIMEAAGSLAIPVLAVVNWLTNPSKGTKLPRAERKRMDREHLAKAPADIKVLKALDRIINLRDMKGSGDDGFIELYAEESVLLLSALQMPPSLNDIAPELGEELSFWCKEVSR